MQHLEEGLIHAWLDGALPADEAARVAAHAGSCAECGAMVAEARGLIAASSRIVSSLDVTPGGVLPAFGAKPRRAWRVTPYRAAIAATVVIGIGLFGVRDGSDPERALVEPPNAQAPMAANADSAIPVRDSVTVISPQPEVAPPPRLTASARRDRQTTSKVEEVAPTVAAAPLAPPPPASIPVAAGGATVAAEMRAADVMSSARIDSISQKRAFSVDSLRSTLRLDSAVRREVAVGSARSVVGNVGGGRGGGRMAPQSAPAAAAGFAVASAPFVGCYELNESTSILPARFALGPNPARMGGLLEVRYVDSTGRSTELIQDAGWTVEGGLAVIRAAARGRLLTLNRADSTVTGESVSGPRTGRVTVCR